MLLEVLLGVCVWAQWSLEVHFDQCVSRCLPWYTRTRRGECLKPPGEAWNHLAISPHTSGASKIEEERKAQHPLEFLIPHFWDGRGKEEADTIEEKTLHRVHALFCPNTLFSFLQFGGFSPQLLLSSCPGQALPPASRLCFYGSPHTYS